MLLLDIQMPIINGIQTMKLVKEKFARFNEEIKLNQMTGKSADDVMLRPLICYLSHFDKESMFTQMTKEDQADCYLEKPLPLKELICLLRLIKVK